MENAGVQVAYGEPNLKVHSKLTTSTCEWVSEIESESGSVPDSEVGSGATSVCSTSSISITTHNKVSANARNLFSCRPSTAVAKRSN
ncbi:MAG: hypothetical protein ACE1Y4_10535 [Lysobacterales bacterium]